MVLMEAIKAPRGTADILPESIPTWRRIERTAEAWFDRYGFHEVRTPIFEATELFARGMGEATDVVGKEMYTFVDRGERSLTLRPEGTAGAVRAYLEHRLGERLGSPTRLWYAGPMFRYERPQKGRQRQFHQLGVEVLGSTSPLVDAETILLAVDIFAALELGYLEVQLNSLGCPECRPRYREILVVYLEAHRAAYCETCIERTATNPLRVLDCKVPGCRELNRAAPDIQQVLCEPCRTHQDRLLALLDVAGVAWKLTPTLVRGLDYYTRTVFEIVSDSSGLGSQNTLCAGGRYDQLVEELGGPPTPGVGWAFGEERLALLLGEGTGSEAPDLVLAPLGEAAERQAFLLAHELRESGVRVELGSGKLDRQIKHATRLNARYLGIIGDDELARGELTLKDLAARSQETVSFGKIAERLLSQPIAAPQGLNGAGRARALD